MPGRSVPAANPWGSVEAKASNPHAAARARSMDRTSSTLEWVIREITDGENGGTEEGVVFSSQLRSRFFASNSSSLISPFA
jgi:hypothetical protein